VLLLKFCSLGKIQNQRLIADMTPLRYRREIDGLRALALLPVILFHAGFETFSGGFVGVDVFFVISGYLITTIILAELEQGKFSIVNFYERRARRILPALFLVMVVCIPFAWFWLLPSDMNDFSQSLVAVSVFASNILFWRESGYFDAEAEFKPLLHMWSLAVEEQFYVLFPLFLMLFWKLGKRWIFVTLGLVFSASLAVAEWGVLNHSTAAFYLLPTRGWELLIGAFAAFYLSQANRKEFGKGLSDFGGWLGVALILYAVFAYSKATPFPGFYALVPAIGALLFILFATQQSTVARFVGNKVFVGIGLISYSAYLWHQPLFAFVRHRNLLAPNQFVFSILSILALILAYFSWRFIEAPFRKKSLVSRRSIFLYSLVGSFLFIFVGFFGHLTDGKFYGRINSSISDLDLRAKVNYGLSIDCEGDYNVSSNCVTSENPEVMLWGDSYAMHLAKGFVVSNPSIRLVQKTVSGCGPFLGIAPNSPKYARSWAEKCIAINDQVYEYLKKTQSIKYVVLSSPFRQFVSSDATVLTRDGKLVNGKDVAVDVMLDTVNKIKSLGKTPVIFSPTPQNGENVGKCLMKAVFFQDTIEHCNVRYADSLKNQSDVWSFLKEVSSDVKVVNLTDFLCRDDTCRASFDDVFIYRDDGHLAHEGSAYLGAKMNFYQILVDAEKSVK
jgi:peptidoglycan/LPS O-acetylase OafA/YrhL